MTDREQRLYAVQAARRRVVLSARSVLHARQEGLRLLGMTHDQRDQLEVGEPEEEEVEEWERTL